MKKLIIALLSISVAGFAFADGQRVDLKQEKIYCGMTRVKYNQPEAKIKNACVGITDKSASNADVHYDHLPVKSKTEPTRTALRCEFRKADGSHKFKLTDCTDDSNNAG